MKKVLIIEDHTDMHELLIWQVELMGFEAISARDGKEGLEKAIVEKPELILWIS
jgi:DNA-binding response OmpR family regulator